MEIDIKLISKSWRGKENSGEGLVYPSLVPPAPPQLSSFQEVLWLWGWSLLSGWAGGGCPALTPCQGAAGGGRGTGGKLAAWRENNSGKKRGSNHKWHLAFAKEAARDGRSQLVWLTNNKSNPVSCSLSSLCKHRRSYPQMQVQITLVFQSSAWGPWGWAAEEFLDGSSPRSTPPTEGDARGAENAAMEKGDQVGWRLRGMRGLNRIKGVRKSIRKKRASLSQDLLGKRILVSCSSPSRICSIP